MRQNRFVVAFLTGLLSVLPGVTQSNATPYVNAVEWSRDGSHVALVTRESLNIYDSSFRLIASQTFPADLAFVMPDIALSPHGERIYVGREKIDPRIADTTSLERYCMSNGSAAVCASNAILDTSALQLLVDIGDIVVASYTAEWSSDGLSIAFRSDYDRATSIYSASDGTLLRTFSSPPPIWTIGYEGGVEWSPNNLYFARAGGNGVYILDALSGQLAALYQFENETILDVAWSPDNVLMAILTTADVEPETPERDHNPSAINGARRNSLIIFDVASGQIVSKITEPDISLSVYLVWSPDGTQIAGGSASKVYVWDANTGALLDSYQIPPYLINSLAYSPYGGRLMIGFKTRPVLELIDPNFVPLSTFTQPKLDGVIHFVAPDASPDRLTAVLTQCVADTNAFATGQALIEAQQYAEFVNWVNQQPTTVLPIVCADDLHVVALSVLHKQSAPPLTAHPTLRSIPTATSTAIPTAIFTPMPFTPTAL